MDARAKDIFSSLLEQPTANRDAYLAAVCEGEATLCAEIRSLLDWDAKAEGVFEEAIAQLAQAITPDEGLRVGNWILREEIGSGGMGTVFRAERADGQVRQQAAIKFIRGGGESLRARFLREQQILARLDHPRIARLIEAGVSADGLSFMAMEYFPGRSITEFAELRQLGHYERIELLRKVCDAVDHAHRNLIVHRDLKPSNILVNDDGEPKLLDFGIARLLEATDGETPLTRTGLFFFTPDYASPEQIDGRPVTTATDVYSLGAILYELLTGKRVHHFSAITPQEIVATICHQPIPPSRLGNDLDAILSKALQKDPERRYGSVRQFADDLERFLDGRPVLARPETASYRLKLFLRRNRTPVAAAAFALLSLCTGTGVALWQASVARSDAAEATRRFAQVRGLAHTVLFDFDAKIRDLPGATEARELLVTTALKYLDDLSAEKPADPSLLREVAEAYERVGDVLGQPARPNLGRRPEAIASYRKAKAIRDGLPIDGLADELAMARLCLKLYAVEGGKELAESGVAATRAALGRHSHQPEVFELAMQAENALGSYYRNRSNGRGAIDHYNAALRIGEQWRSEAPSPRALESIAGALALKARAALLTGEPELTIQATERMLAIEAELLQHEPRNAVYRRQLFKAHLLRGYALGHPDYFHLGRTAEAAVAFRHAITLAKSNLVADASDALAKGDLGDAYWALAVTIAEKEPVEAHKLLEASLAESLALVKGSPSTLAFIHNAASSHAALALPLRAMGDTATAARHLREALRLQTEVAEARPQQIGLRHNLIDTLVSLTHVEIDRQNLPAAGRAIEQALAIAKTVERDDSYLSKIPSLANLDEAAGRYHSAANTREAASYYRKAIAHWDELAAAGISPAVVQPKQQGLRAALAAIPATNPQVASLKPIAPGTD